MRNSKSYTTLDFYDYYRERMKEDQQYDISLIRFRKVFEEFLKIIASEIIDNSKEVRLPCRLGYLSVIKSKPKTYTGKSLRIDYHESKVQNKLVYHINLHSNFYKFRFHWDKHSMMTPNKSKYQFIASRANKRKLAQTIKHGLQDYREHTYG